MGLTFRRKVAVLSDTVSVEDAEPLLDWLNRQKGAKVDLAACTHLHPANLQVLLAAGVEIKAWPADTRLTSWLRTVLRGP
jgi:hypothetical protein